MPIRRQTRRCNAVEDGRRFCAHRAWLITCGLLCAAGAGVVVASDKSPTAVVETPLGIEGTFYARYDGPAIASLPVDERSAVIVRIADVVDDNGSMLYELRYIGLRAGEHDLRDFLVRVDGEPLTEFEPATVRVTSSLPADHDGGVAGLALPQSSHALPYRAIGWGFGALWGAITLWLIVRRWLARSTQPPVVADGELTLADQLRPLVEAAVAGRLTSAEMGRLELLLIGYWRQELELSGCSPTESLKQMRNHTEAGALLRQLEDWLHRQPGTVDVDVAGTLAPYRDRAAIDTRILVAEGVVG